jgi:hypothetical protein
MPNGVIAQIREGKGRQPNLRWMNKLC